MAMTSALMPSPTLASAFSPYSESPSSPAHFSNLYSSMQRQSTNDSLAPPPSPYPATVDPSPVESTKSASTDATDIEDDGARDVDDIKSPDIELISPASQDAHLPPPTHVARLATDAATIAHAGADDGPQSVIHIPSTFRQFTNPLPTTHEEQALHSTSSRRSDGKRSPPLGKGRTSPTATERSASMASSMTAQYPYSSMQRDTAPINTSVPPARSGAGSTPRASTQEEAEAEWRKSGSQLEEHKTDGNAGSQDSQDSQEPVGGSEEPAPQAQITSPLSPPPAPTSSADGDIAGLKEALTECWTLCKTLSKMSSTHRQRQFNFSGTGEMQDNAWKSCWTLCQTLYQGAVTDQDPTSQVREILILCREFCQALFEARDKRDPVKDSILRVSFELNNHLFNTRNPELPDAFTERTLEFYVTLCHRLIKDRTSLPEDTDQLLRACWTLAECFFTFRERSLEKKPIDEETLSSTVQACWDLCDMFRERWSLLRPERGTPKPHQRSFQTTSYNNSYAPSTYSHNSISRPESALSVDRDRANRLLGPRDIYGRSLPPETPTTIMDERDDDDGYSPNDAPPPNLLVYGADTSRNSSRWPSSASNASGYSDASGSQHTAGSSRTAKGSVKGSTRQGQTSPKSVASSRPGNGSTIDPSQTHLTGIKALVLRAALNKGFSRNNMNVLTLQAFVRGLPATAMFGPDPWQRQLSEQYKRLILTDPFMQENNLPINRRFSAQEISSAVRWISKNEHYRWLQSLFDAVFGFTIDAAEIQNRGPGLTV